MPEQWVCRFCTPHRQQEVSKWKSYRFSFIDGISAFVSCIRELATSGNAVQPFSSVSPSMVGGLVTCVLTVTWSINRLELRTAWIAVNLPLSLNSTASRMCPSSVRYFLDLKLLTNIRNVTRFAGVCFLWLLCLNWNI